MREKTDLFHGKRKDNGEWIEGYYACVAGNSVILTGRLDVTGGKIGAEALAVIPETVGQFVGGRDKNDRRIFEGDIVKTKFDRICKVVWLSSWEDKAWSLVPIDCINLRSDNKLLPDKYDLWHPENLEIIGNIFDNPELIEIIE